MTQSFQNTLTVKESTTQPLWHSRHCTYNSTTGINADCLLH